MQGKSTPKCRSLRLLDERGRLLKVKLVQVEKLALPNHLL